jgi:hypothetical protein
MVADLSSPLHMQYVLETRGSYCLRAMESTKKPCGTLSQGF